jgi:hypothetical protein
VQPPIKHQHIGRLFHVQATRYANAPAAHWLRKPSVRRLMNCARSAGYRCQ